jgi:hypothetical protein
VGTTSPPVAGKLYLGLGIGLLFLGPILYMVQIWARLLRVPWYAPALATIGAALLLVAVLRRPTVWRILALALGVLLVVGQWHFLLSKSKLPDYNGPVVLGTAFPAFTTTLADGSTFDQDGLRGEQNTAMVFFRGRW